MGSHKACIIQKTEILKLILYDLYLSVLWCLWFDTSKGIGRKNETEIICVVFLQINWVIQNLVSNTQVVYNYEQLAYTEKNWFNMSQTIFEKSTTNIISVSFFLPIPVVTLSHSWAHLMFVLIYLVANKICP